LRDEVVTREELAHVETQLGQFGTDNRAGLPATLHRISAMRNRRGDVVGLTMRVGRAVSGIVDILRDLIENGESILLMGRPGLGKTTMLREIARVLASDLNKRVVIVDTSNEIAGDGDVPHPAIGRARRMQVARVDQQHDVMIEAVENHMPEVVVIDEIGRIEETLAARTIAERGVQLVATVHGNTLDNLLANPTMSDLVGGISSVTLSDEEARRRGTQKTVLERKAPPTFDVVVEMIERHQIAVRRPVADVVDALLRGWSAPPELRWRDENGEIHIEEAAPIDVPERVEPARGGRGDESDHRSRRNTGGRNKNGRSENRENGRRDLDRETSRQSNRRNPLSTVDLDRTPDESEAAIIARRYQDLAAGRTPETVAEPIDDNEDEMENGPISDEERALPAHRMETELVDPSRVRRLYPFAVSRSRLSRAIKHLGAPVSLARRWQDADAILMLGGVEGLDENSSLLREPRELGLPIITVRGNTYSQILSRLDALYSGGEEGGESSPKDMALKEASAAAARVQNEAEPVETAPAKQAVPPLATSGRG
jgi:stage III sporulation protein SpoIIIAA